MFQPIFFIYSLGYYWTICWLLRNGEINGGGPSSKGGGIPNSGGGIPNNGGILKSGGGGGSIFESEGGGGSIKFGIPMLGMDDNEGGFIRIGGGGGGGKRWLFTDVLPCYYKLFIIFIVAYWYIWEVWVS